MSKRLKHINQLDSIRAFAAFIVIFYHFLPDFQLGGIWFGYIGVDMFFVISGYLITAVLLEQKFDISSRILIIKNFVIKRSLRLFPIYYLFISFLAILMYACGMYVWDRGNEIYYFTYTQNILFFNEGMKGIQANHLWTLAVEEQFYLFWPWLVIYLSNKKLIGILIFVIPLTMLYKSFLSISDLKMLTIYHFDTLGSGALIALLIKEKTDIILLFLNRMKIILILFSMILLTVATFVHLVPLLISFAILVMSISVVIGCYFNFNGVVGQVLNSDKLQYLGKISYGLYLYHKPVPFFVKLLIGKTNLSINNFSLLVLSISITIIASIFSYHVLEKNFIRLKDKFDL